MQKLKRNKKALTELKILAMLGLFSVSVGLWENFRQLWLQENGYSASEVSLLTSVGLGLSAFGVLLVGSRLKVRQLKPFMTGMLVLKFLSLLLLFSLNQSGNRLLINFLIVADILASYVMVASVYPLITMVCKSNRVYSRRKLVEYWAKDIGVLVGGIMLSQTWLGAQIDYNESLLIAAIFLVFAIMIMFGLKVRVIEYGADRQPSIAKYILKSRLQVCYMIYAFLAAMSFAAALGLKMLMLTDSLGLSTSTATDFLLIVGIISDVVGVLALRYFTPKNDYLTLALKFGIRMLSYVLAVLATDPFVSMLAITWSIMVSTAYEDVTDGYYINLVDNRHQLSYSTVKHVMSFSGEAVGMLLCGAMYDLGMPYIFGAAALVTGVQIGVACYLVYLRKNRRRVRHSASRMRYSERVAEE